MGKISIDGDKAIFLLHLMNADDNISDAIVKKYSDLICEFEVTKKPKKESSKKKRYKGDFSDLFYFAEKKLSVYRVGDKIHIHSRNGTYELIDIRENSLIISCKRWRAIEDVKNFHEIPLSDFKCLAGGMKNWIPKD